MRPSARGLLSLPLFWLVLSFPMPAHAEGHGGGGGGPAPMSFVVNLPSMKGDRFLKVDFVLDAASPEVSTEIGVVKPRILHQVILLLSDAKDEILMTREGKRQLAASIREVVNKTIRESEKTGVKEVLFTDFLIQ
ncbi:MAG: flagellar basal body-associated protein FliL [Actinomycetota bacterium]